MFLVAVFILFTMQGIAQYQLTKTEKQVRESYRSPDLLQKTKVNDTTFMLVVFVPEFQKTYFIDSRKDSCVMEFIGFISYDYQLTYMKELNEKWIPTEKNKWKTYLHGGAVYAFFTREKLSGQDGVLFSLIK